MTSSTELGACALNRLQIHEMVLTVFCSEMTMATRCSILEGSLTFLAIFRTVEAVRLSVLRMWTLPIAEKCARGARAKLLR